MLMLRLQRVGKIKSPSYRLVVSEKAKDTQSGSLEILGQYDPTKNPKVINFKKDRIEHWLSVGAQTSNTVHNLFLNAGILQGEKKKSVYLSKKRKEKIAAAKTEQAKAEESAKAAEAEKAAKQQAEEATKQQSDEAAKAAEAAASASVESPVAPEQPPAEQTPAPESEVKQ